MKQVFFYLLTSLFLGFALFTQLLIFFPIFSVHEPNKTGPTPPRTPPRFSYLQNDEVFKPVTERMTQILSKSNKYPQTFDMFYLFGILFLFGEICLIIFVILKFILGIVYHAFKVGTKLLIYLLFFSVLIAGVLVLFGNTLPDNSLGRQHFEQTMHN